MPHIRRSLFALAVAATVALPLAAPSAAADLSGCRFPDFGTDRKPVIDACTKLLDETGLTARDRAHLLTMRGRMFYMARDLDAAARDLDAAIGLTPGDPGLLVHRGWVAYQGRDYDRAFALVKNALDLDADNAPAIVLLSAVAVRTGNLPLARTAIDKAVALKADSVQARLQRVVYFDRVGAQREALAELEALLKLDTSDLDTLSTVWHDREMSYRTIARLEHATELASMGRFDEAETAYDNFIKAEPGVVSYGWRGWYMYRRDRFDRAKSDFATALGYDPNYWLIHNLLGYTLLYSKDYAPAFDAFSKALALKPGASRSLWGRSLALRAMQRVDDAEKDALAAVGNNPGFLLQKAKVFSDLGYLRSGWQNADVRVAVRDAVKACMLDDRCW